MNEHYYYECIHIPTGKRFIKRKSVDDFVAPHSFIKKVMEWNAAGGIEWKYWCNVYDLTKNPRWKYDEVKTLSDGDTCLVGAA